MLSSFSFSEDTVGFLIEGEFSESVANKLHVKILEKLKVYDRINLYLEDSNIENFSMTAVVQDILFKLEHKEHFNKVALVTDRKWIHLCGKLESMLAGVNIKNFTTEDRLKAMSWIAER